VLQEKNRSGFTAVCFGFCQKKPISGHTTVLLLVVARKQKIEAGSPLFVLVSVKQKLSGHTAVLLLVLVVARELNIAVTPLFLCFFSWKTKNKRFQAVTPLLDCYLV